MQKEEIPPYVTVSIYREVDAYPDELDVGEVLEYKKPTLWSFNKEAFANRTAGKGAILETTITVDPAVSLIERGGDELMLSSARFKIIHKKSGGSRHTELGLRMTDAGFIALLTELKIIDFRL